MTICHDTGGDLRPVPGRRSQAYLDRQKQRESNARSYPLSVGKSPEDLAAALDDFYFCPKIGKYWQQVLHTTANIILNNLVVVGQRVERISWQETSAESYFEVAYRNAVIINSLTGKTLYPVNHSNVFQKFWVAAS